MRYKVQAVSRSSGICLLHSLNFVKLASLSSDSITQLCEGLETCRSERYFENSNVCNTFDCASSDVASRRSGRTAVWNLALTLPASFTPTVRVNSITPSSAAPVSPESSRVPAFKHAHSCTSQHERRTTVHRVASNKATHRSEGHNEVLTYILCTVHHSV